MLLLNLVARRAVHRVTGDDAPSRLFSAWRQFPATTVRADLTGDVVRNAGHEETFPWRLAPLRAAAILTTVGLGALMGLPPVGLVFVPDHGSVAAAVGTPFRLDRPR